MMEEFDDKEVDRVIEDLLKRGLIEIYGIEEETGDFTYRVTEKCKDEYPEFFQEHFAFINEMAFSLWQDGYIEMKFDDYGVPMVMLKNLDYHNEVFPKLNSEERFFIENMIYLEQHRDDII